MKLKNIKIGTLLLIGITAILTGMGVLAITSIILTNKMHHQAEMLFENPLEARTAIGEIRADAYLIHWALETTFLYDTYVEQYPFLQTIEQAERRLQANLDLLGKVYQGDTKPIDKLRNIALHCKHNRDEVLHLLAKEDTEAANQINIHAGSVIGSAHFDEIVHEIDVLTQEAKNQAQNLLNASHLLNNRMQFLMTGVSLFMVLVTLFVAFMTLLHIRNPVRDISTAARAFSKGDLDVRVNYHSGNELGEMATSFNAMAANIQEYQKLNEEAGNVSGNMLNVIEKEPFFKAVLQQIMRYTASDLGVVYLLADDKKTFDHQFSIGCDEPTRQSFSAIYPEGEFGMAITEQKVHHVKGLALSKRFVFHAACGEYVPSEMIVVPLVASGSVNGVISLASLQGFSQHAVALIEKIHLTFSARVEGLLAYEKIHEDAMVMAQQNSELQSQKQELDMQTRELSEINRELSLQHQQLLEANKLKISFLSNMSHELRTPLNSVIALARVLEKKLVNKLPEEEADYMSVIERNALQLLGIIDDILDIARIDAGKEEVRISEFKPEALVNEIVDLIRPQLTNKPVVLSNLAYDQGIIMCSDPDKMSHILRNIIGNAVKFTEEGSVQVTVDGNEKEVVVKVRDTGIGISAHELPYIFNEFRQGDSSASRRFEGTGLGLAIARKYAEMLGGMITVESQEGKGALFMLALPRALPRASEMASPVEVSDSDFIISENHCQSPLIVDEAQPRTILVVEDSEPAIIQVKDMLNESGYSVLVARNGSEALDMLSHTMPDAMIVDLMMPGVDGFELLALLRNREETARVPVLILTAKHISKEELQFLKQNKIFQLVRKGDVRKEELLKVVAAMMMIGA